MSDVFSYLWLIPFLPLLAAAVTALFGRVLGRHSHWPCVLAVGASALLSLMTFFAVRGTFEKVEPGKPATAVLEKETHKVYYTWFETGRGSPDHVEVGLNLRADPLSAVMLVTVTFIGTLIAVYSIGYMHGDPGYPRFFASVALFIFSMTLLVLGNNLLVLYAGWEGVGLCSYLLIGFWFSKPAAADAARKAFLVTRIGDFGLLLGIMLIWWLHPSRSLDYDAVFGAARDGNPGMAEWMTVICLLIFCGAAGKSAQFPLHVWLPDAMEGPTPVSALIHAATMVTAGVYLVARCAPLFVAAPDAQLVVACIGGFTALFSALIALTQNDLKRVLAYSTLSQLGYMFLALGSGVGDLVTFASTAAIFHLFTHAFFKALLFLGAGSVMHAMGGVIDIRHFSGLKKVMPHTRWTFLVGSLALAGLPPLAGFWSKDEVLAVTFEASRHSAHGMIYGFLFVAGLLTAGLTAFYTFRAYFLTFEGPLKLPPEAGHHGHDAHAAHGHGHGHAAPQAHESPAVMTVPLMILAVCAALVGLVFGPTHLFAGFLAKTPYFPLAPVHEFNVTVLAGSILFAAAGLGLAWFFYVKRPDLPKSLAKAIPVAYNLSLNKFYVDDLYSAFLVRPFVGLAEFIKTFDKDVLDEAVDLIAEIPRLIGSWLRPLQNGLVQYYAVTMLIGLTMLLIALARS